MDSSWATRDFAVIPVTPPRHNGDMCTTLAALVEAVADYAASFDAARLLGREASRVVDHATALRNMADTLAAQAAARAEDCGAWQRTGDRSPAHHLARISGMTVGAAIQAMDTARRLEDLPQVKAAAVHGRLSAQQTAAIASAAVADPDAESRLVEEAGRVSLKELHMPGATSGPTPTPKERGTCTTGTTPSAWPRCWPPSPRWPTGSSIGPEGRTSRVLRGLPGRRPGPSGVWRRQCSAEQCSAEHNSAQGHRAGRLRHPAQGLSHRGRDL
jgi:hypothetical protein